MLNYLKTLKLCLTRSTIFTTSLFPFEVDGFHHRAAVDDDCLAHLMWGEAVTCLNLEMLAHASGRTSLIHLRTPSLCLVAWRLLLVLPGFLRSSVSFCSCFSLSLIFSSLLLLVAVSCVLYLCCDSLSALVSLSLLHCFPMPISPLLLYCFT